MSFWFHGSLALNLTVYPRLFCYLSKEVIHKQFTKEKNNPDLYVWRENEERSRGDLRLMDRRCVDFTLLIKWKEQPGVVWRGPPSGTLRESVSALLKVLESVPRDWFGLWDSWTDLRETVNPFDITTTKYELACMETFSEETIYSFHQSLWWVYDSSQPNKSENKR